MNDGVILFVSILIAILFTVFNLTTAAIPLMDRKLRSRISNYPVISFLIASTFQGAVAAPIYTFQQMEHKEHVTGWVCDLSRISYYLCHHLVKISLVVVSFDRLVCIKFPFRYKKMGEKRNMVVLLVLCWIVTATIDMLPFIHVNDDEVCHYVPNKRWTLFIILVYNITPFLLIAINYIQIWSIAAKMALLDRSVSSRLQSRSSPTCAEKREHYKSASLRRNEQQTKVKGKFQFMLELKATKTSLALMGVYVVCWGPLGLYYVIDNFCNGCLFVENKRKKDVKDALTYLCFSSNLLAPLFYCWLSNEYRKAGKRILRKSVLNKAESIFSRTRTSEFILPVDLEMTSSTAKAK